MRATSDNPLSLPAAPRLDCGRQQQFGKVRFLYNGSIGYNGWAICLLEPSAQKDQPVARIAIVNPRFEPSYWGL